jgi:hypothetical protein
MTHLNTSLLLYVYTIPMYIIQLYRSVRSIIVIHIVVFIIMYFLKYLNCVYNTNRPVYKKIEPFFFLYK